MENVNIITIFLTGLFTGGLTCMAVQGGLLATMLCLFQLQWACPYPFVGILMNPIFASFAMAMSSVSVVSNSLFLKWQRI